MGMLLSMYKRKMSPKARLCLLSGGAVKMASLTCSSPDASFFDGVGDSNPAVEADGQKGLLDGLSMDAPGSGQYR